MRTLFWRVFAAFCLALLLVAGLAFGLAQLFNPDKWILNSHPAFSQLTQEWIVLHEQNDVKKANNLLLDRQRQYSLETQVFDINSRPISISDSRHHSRGMMHRGQWMRLTQEVTSESGQEYLFVFRIPESRINFWQTGAWFVISCLLLIALVVLVSISFWLTSSITNPLNKLRHAVHELGQSSYQQTSLQSLSQRGDELGALARDFNAMGTRLQNTLAQQKQLLRDVSHELRSPLARLKISLALAQRADDAKRQDMWPKLERECDRLDALIGEILALARLDNHSGEKQEILLFNLFEQMREDAQVVAPEQKVVIHCDKALTFSGWPALLEHALNNLLNNALRFNPAGSAIELKAYQQQHQLLIQVRDHGPGADPAILNKLAEPFFRAPNQKAQGYGLGLAIAKRAIEEHQGQLAFTNSEAGGLLVTISLPM